MRRHLNAHRPESRPSGRLLLLLAATAVSAFLAVDASRAGSGSSAASDPGPRQGAPGAGGPLSALTSDEATYFQAGQEFFQEVHNLQDGLGPEFDLDRCSGCHAYPSAGGSSPAINPQPTVATAYGAVNLIPKFVQLHGPVVEARFRKLPSGAPDGHVHQLFVITGREDGTVDLKNGVNHNTCNAVQPDFDAEYAKGNVALRIPTPTFGAGLIEAISDSAIVANLAANGAQKASLGISGHPNYGDGAVPTITRFGWKAQNKSLLGFAGEASINELGVTNQLFQNELDDNPLCQFAPAPNNETIFDNFEGVPAPFVMSEIELFAAFMRFLAPPAPSTTTPGGATSIANGGQLFNAIGCALCHAPALTTVTDVVQYGAPNAINYVAALSGVTANLYSDLALHKMGPGLADGIVQGQAAGDEFRTAPLWGLGQRLFFLHDGRTSDLVQAIGAHASPGNANYGPSEANQVIQNYNALSNAQQQDLLNFLRSL
ncbi:MAG TPA: di-heme oxidoredictase family protein [Methylocystis sp.]|nr:di-heme oxidoredictase family protein [Methylocystis sp.]